MYFYFPGFVLLALFPLHWSGLVDKLGGMGEPYQIIDTQKGRPLSKKEMAFITLRQAGFNPGAAAEGIGLSKQRGYQLDRQLEKYSLKTPALAKLAKQAVTETLKMESVQRQSVLRSGEVVTYEDKPTVSNRLDAARLVLERTEPAVKKTESVNLNAGLFVPVDLSKYLMPGETMPGGPSPEALEVPALSLEPGSEVIEVTPEPGGPSPAACVQLSLFDEGPPA